MRLLRVEVWNFRGIEHHVLDDLAPDLNLVVGPNEAGKSRLFQAIQFALFERYKGEGEDKRALKSWGASESPKVRIEFEVGGVRFSLTKQFLKGAFARLEGGGRTFENDEAEDKVRELWGTRAPERGKKAAEEALGIWPLLWVPQGRAGFAPHVDLNEDTRGRLRDTLAVEVAEVAAGAKGQRLLRRIEDERAKYWTAGGKETGDLRVARDKHDAARAGLTRAAADLDAARALADSLDVARDKLRDVEPRLRAQKDALARAVAAAESARERARAIETARAQRDQWKSSKAHAEEALAQRDAAERDREQLARAAAEAEAMLREIATRWEAHRAHEESAREASAVAHAALDCAEQMALRARRQAERVAGRVELERAREALACARRDNELLDEVTRQLAEHRVGAKEIRALRAASERASSAQAALNAASAHLRLRALKDIVVDGRAVKAGEEIAWACDDEQTVNVDGILRFDVSPGAAELPRLREEALSAKRELGAMLDRLGVASPAEAEERHVSRTKLEAQRDERRAAASRSAPRGLDALERAFVESSARVDALGEDEPDAPTIDAASEAVSSARDEAKACGARREAIASDAARLHAERAQHEQRRADANERLRRIDERLASPPSRADLEAARAAAEASWAEAEARLAALEHEHRRQGGLVADEDVERERRSFDRLAGERARAHDDAVALEAKLAQAGASGLLEAKQSAEEAAERAERDLVRVERAARAILTLSESVRQARRETQERLVAPVIERVVPWLQMLLPHASLRIDESWSVLGLRTGDTEEPLDALSGGAREQIGILVRLGLADVLARDEGLPIVLDDSLAYTDAERHAEMLRILYRASKRQQIIVFSCHSIAFDRLGETKRFELPARRAR